MNMLKFSLIILSILFITLQYHLWFGKGSHEEYDALQRLIIQQQQENTRLQARNDDLKADIVDLKQGFNSVEERARSELGMMKPNEVFYQIIE